MVSTSETFPQQFDASTYDSTPAARPRYDSNQLLMLPAPLAVTRTPGVNTNASASTTVFSRSSEEGYAVSDVGSQQHLVSSPNQDGFYPEDYENAGRYTPSSQGSPFEQRVSRAAGNSGVLRHSQQQYPTEIQNNPYNYEQAQVQYTPEPDEYASRQSPPPAIAINRARGISLADNGPVPGPEGVRRVARQSNRRSQSQAPAPAQNRYSRSSFPALPPGAAPPQPGGGL